MSDVPTADRPTSATFSSVLETARSGVPDRYAAALFAPSAVRGDLIALAAFEAEIGAVPDRVSDPMLGEIRLQWWRDEIGRMGEGAASAHPVAAALASAMRRHRLPPGLLLAMIDVVSVIVGGDPIPDDVAFRSLLAKAGASPVLLAGHCLGVAADPRFAATATAAGHTLALNGLLGDLPRHFSRGRIPLPTSLIEEAGVDPHDLLAGRQTPATAALARTLDALLETSHRSALQNVMWVAPSWRPAVLPLGLVPSYSRARRRLGAAALSSTPVLLPLNRLIRLTIVSWTGRFG